MSVATSRRRVHAVCSPFVRVRASVSRVTWIAGATAAVVLFAPIEARAADSGLDADAGEVGDAGPDASDAGDAGPAIVATACSTPADHCERAPFEVSREEVIGADFDFDTGWVPSGSDIQVRLVASQTA